MIRFDLRLLPEDGSNPAEARAIAEANEKADHACKHLKRLIGKKKCRKHPSSPNKIRVFAIKGGDPKAEVVFYCCPAFLKLLKA